MKEDNSRKQSRDHRVPGRQQSVHASPSDEALLARFFSLPDEPIADAGFTGRVMAALPAGEVRGRSLRRWSTGLNVAAGVAVAGCLVWMGISAHW